MLSDWDETPAHYLRLNFTPLFEPEENIKEVFFRCQIFDFFLLNEKIFLNRNLKKNFFLNYFRLKWKIRQIILRPITIQ